MSVKIAESAIFTDFSSLLNPSQEVQSRKIQLFVDNKANIKPRKVDMKY
jgi:hypothetical protein